MMVKNSKSPNVLFASASATMVPVRVAGIEEISFDWLKVSSGSLSSLSLRSVTF